MPSFFLWSESGDAAFLLRRFIKEGHKGRMYVKDPHGKSVYKGIVPLSASADPAKGEIVLFDMVGFGAQADSLRKRGYKVIGASRFSDAIEIDRIQGMDLMRKVGIKTPETFPFKRISDGQKFLRQQKSDEKWYFKPSGHVPTQSTYNGHPKDLVRYLDFVQKDNPPEAYMLQKEKKGTEISLEGWFDGTKWVWPFNSTIEDKKLMVGDHGPRTGCMANAVWAYEESRPILALKTITRCAPYLEAAGYVGAIDLNMVLDEKGEPHGLEWSPRFGYDALQALCCLTNGDMGRQFADFVDGKLDAFNVRTDVYALTLNVSVPPFPNFEMSHKQKGLPLDSKLMQDVGVYLRDVMVENGMPCISGVDCGVATIGAVGTEMGALREELLLRTQGYEIPNAQYRTDPVKRFEKVLTALSSFMYDSPDVRLKPEPKQETYELPEAVRESTVKKMGGSSERVVSSLNVKMPTPIPTPTDAPTF